MWLLLAAILLGGLLLRLYYGSLLDLPTRGPGQGFVVDEQEYYSAASMLADGRGFSFYDTFTWTRAPLYVIFLATIFVVAGKNLALIYALQAAFSVVTLLMLSLLAGRIAAKSGLSRDWAILGCAALGSVWLSFTLFSELLLSETLFLLIFVVALLSLARYFDLPPGSRFGSLLVFGAGVMLGLAALTRSTALGFLPLALVVLIWHSRRTLRSASANTANVSARWPVVVVIPALLLLAGAVLVVAPWTLRNYVAYGRLVPIDTSAGYNLWLGSSGSRDEVRLANELKAIAGPVAKQDFALGQAFDIIKADPLAFVAKGVDEIGDLLAINPTAEERLVGGWSQGRVPAAHLLSLFVFEDLLYVALVLLAVAGLLTAPPDPMKALAVAWVLLWVAMAFVFFAVNRFRFPMVACLLPWAPAGLVYLCRGLRQFLRGCANLPLLGRAALVPAFVALPLLLNLPLGFIDLGVSRWNSQDAYRRGERDLAAGQIEAARTLYLQANTVLNDTKYSLAAADLAIAARSGDSTAVARVAAQAELAPALNAPGSARFEPYLLRGAAELLRSDDEAARLYFGARPVDDNTLSALAWFSSHLRLPAPPDIDIGSDLDAPYIDGFYAAEAYAEGDYRWTSAEALVRVAAGSGHQLAIRWSGWRPGSIAPAQVQVDWRLCPANSDPAACDWHNSATYTLAASDSWTEQVLAVPESTELRLRINGFVPGGFDPRELGVRVDRMVAR